jgi:hypothetical protein
MMDGEDAENGALALGQRVLAILDTGSFTTSYKYATLLALIDEVVEGVDESGEPPSVVHAARLGERVLRRYWPHARPFSEAGHLRQSSQPVTKPDLVAKIDACRTRLELASSVTLELASSQYPNEMADLRDVVLNTVVRWPIPLLQRLGTGAGVIEDRFLFDYRWTAGLSGASGRQDFDGRMWLRPGVGRHLVRLAGLLRPIVEREWTRFVAERNKGTIDELRLERFLFGAERANLGRLRPPLVLAQSGACYYCGGPLRASVEVDHFLPWSRWPDDALDNLVAAHRGCNNSKRDALASVEHVGRWARRFDASSPEWSAVDRLATVTGWHRRPRATLGAARAMYLHALAGTPLWVSRTLVAPSSSRSLQKAYGSTSAAGNWRLMSLSTRTGGERRACSVDASVTRPLR